MHLILYVYNKINDARVVLLLAVIFLYIIFLIFFELVFYIKTFIN